MALVNYSPSPSPSPSPESSPSQDPTPSKRPSSEPAQPAKKPRTTPAGPRPEPRQPGGKDLPPLPDAFHDLYASSVRRSVVDDPGLHQGRRRGVGHVVGRWPSHVYIEWHPTKSQHTLLTSLTSRIQTLFPNKTIQTLLTSDLDAPLPLHVSLSRPLSLPTASKDAFLEDLVSRIKGARLQSFSIKLISLKWFKSPDSNRSFLVLSVVQPSACTSASNLEPNSANENPNPALSTLLEKSNAACVAFDQPRLYTSGPSPRREPGASGELERVDPGAFHVSIAWTLDTLDERERSDSAEEFGTAPFAGIRDWEIRVISVKIKIGNVVTGVSLPSVAGGNG